jgi:transposase
MPPARRLEMTAAEHWSLRQMAEDPGTPTRRGRRAQIVLLAAAGDSNAAIARALHTSRACVARCRARFLAQRLAGIEDGASRLGRPRTISEELLQEIVTRTTTTDPAGARPWTTRTLARQLMVSPKTIHRVWQANGLTPHRMRPLRRPPKGAVLRALAYVVGGYLTPLDSALVLGGDSDAWRPPPRRSAGTAPS